MPFVSIFGPPCPETSHAPIAPVPATRAARVRPAEAEILAALAQCNGTDRYIRHFTNRLIFTDGIDVMREMCDAHWLVDLVASYQGRAPLLDQPFQVWKLERAPDWTETHQAWVATADDGNFESPPLITQQIEYSDFPLSHGIKLYVEDGGPDVGMVLMLPGER